MVKILQAYNFAKQHTYSLNGEILAATIINTNRVAVSSAEQFIEIYDVSGNARSRDYASVNSGVNANTIDAQQIDNSAEDVGNDERSPAKCTLATVGEVVNLIYCDAGKYLLTLEKENIGSPVASNSTSISCTSNSNTTAAYSEDDTKMFVRVYANFSKFPESKLIDLPITIRIASMTTPKAPLVESIDVIELPLRSPPNLIQCCQTSGNIIVSSKDRIYLYEYTQCTHENTQPRFSYIDFLPFKFFVSLNFIPLKLKLSENVIACMNNRYCVAFKVIDVLSNNTGADINRTEGAGTGTGIGTGIGVGNGICGPVGFASVLLDDEYDDYDEVIDVDADEAILSTDSSLIMSKASGVGAGTGIGPSSHNSFETDSLETTSSGRNCNGISGLMGRNPIDFNVARMVNSVGGREFEIDIKSQWEINGGGDTSKTNSSTIHDNQDIMIAPMRASDIKIKLVNEAKAMNVQRISHNGHIYSPTDDEVQYDIRKLLQICMKTNESNGRIVDILRCIDLKAIYQRCPNGGDRGCEDTDATEVYEMGNQQIPSAVSTTKHAVRRTLKSSQHHNCIGYALLVASSVDGYLYQFCAQGKWYNENEKPIATYSFTAPVLQVHINDYVIYAITTDSVETHTSRIGHKLFNNRFEYPSISNLFPEESSPDMTAPITVVGLCSFLHVQHICVNREQLVMISNSALATENSSNKRRSGGSSTGAHTEVKRNIAARLIAEAKAKHHLLRSSNSNAATGTAQNPTANTEWTLYSLQIPKVEHVVEDLEAVAETYRAASSTNFYDLMEEAHVILRLSLSLQCEKFENEKELANFSIRSTKKHIYLQATGFYKMCNIQLSDIYSSYIDMLMQASTPHSEQCDTLKTVSKRKIDNAFNSEELVGLIYTVKVFLLALGTDRMKASFLNQLVKPFFTPSRVVEQGYPLVPLSLEFLNMFIKYSPADISQIMLNSPVLADTISGELINYLKYLEKLTPDENLLLAVTACRMSNYLLSQETISETSRRDLALSLIEHKNVLFDDGTVLCDRQQRDGIKVSAVTTTTTSTSRYRQNGQNSSIRTPSKMKFLSQSPNGSGNAATAMAITAAASFSDFTETILLASENSALIEAISDAFIHALCIECSVSLDMILQLFLNYIATHIGHKGYQTSQKVFVNILQVYYYDLFDISPLSYHSNDMHSQTPIPNEENDSIDDAVSKADSSICERDNESIGNSNGESNSCTSVSMEDSVPIQQQQQPQSSTTTTATAKKVIKATNYNNNNNGYRRKILYDILQEQQSPIKRNSFSKMDRSSQFNLAIEQNNETNLKGLKILFRMYLGRLKALSDLIVDLQSADIEQQAPNEDFQNLRMDCIKFMTKHLQELSSQQDEQQQQQRSTTATINRYYYVTSGTGSHKQQQHAHTINNEDDRRKLTYVPYIPDYKLSAEQFERHISEYIRPMPCLLQRPQYLNRLPPFRRSDFSYPNRDEGENEARFVGWHNEVLTLTLKIQSLLSYSKIDREIVEEFIAFIQKTPDLIGIDSFLVIVLPKNLAINYMLGFCPEFLWHYGKSNAFTPKHWESLIRKIMDKPDLLPNWKAHLTEILDHLVAELSFEELMQCFPSEVLLNRNSDEICREFIDNRLTYENDRIVYDTKTNLKTIENTNTNGSSKIEPHVILRDHLPLDNIDENNVFELTLRKAVSKQRSIALRSMIESTGIQLFDATSNPMYNL